VRAAISRIPPEARPWALALAVALLIVAAVIAVAAGVLAPGRGGASGPPDAVDAAVEDLPFAGTSNPPTTPVPALVVHAAGAVAQPGLYRLDAGSRVGDLLSAAGGVATDGDLDRVNLAAVLVDGSRVYVPRRGEPDIPSLAEADSPGGTSSGSAERSEPGPVDLNRATTEQLETLPGVGPSIAAAIIDHRERNGPFGTVDELVDVRGIGPARLEQLRPLVRV
jgi:competence protein ComEA